MSNIYLDVPSTIVLNREALIFFAEAFVETYLILGLVSYIYISIYGEWDESDPSRVNPVLVLVWLTTWFSLLCHDAVKYDNMKGDLDE